MTRWHYVCQEEQRGPVGEEELRRMIESGTLPADTRVWSEGMADWHPASALPQFSASPYAAPASGINDEVNWDDYTPSGPQVRPWVRYWARTADLLVFIMLAGMVVGLIHPEWAEANDTVFGLVLLVAYNFVEALMLSVWGNTPMKWILGVRVRDRSGRKLGYSAALGRCFKVWIKGEGLGIPLVSLITHITAYNTLANHGVTSWDREGGFTVSHRKIVWWRWVLLAAVMAGIISLMVLGNRID